MGNFNSYYVVTPLTMLMMFVIGWNKYGTMRIESNERKIVRNYTNSLVADFSLGLSSLIGCLVLIESWRGLIAILDIFRAPNDSSAWSLILVPFVVIAMVIIYAGFLYTLASLGSKMKKYLLKKRYKL